ncbi:MAG TPA: tetratricopeptide repeat protein, partial [Anaerolineaceae bacterium]|nr:tetratricopeptide repeat protein [Anaerolineaceae bacterium]
NNVGYLNNFLGNYQQARAEIHRAIRLFEQTGAYVTAAQAYDSLGETFLALGDFAAARREFQLAYDRMRANEQKYDEAFVLANLARVDAAEGEYLQAETKFREAIRMLEETGIHKEVAVVYGNLGALYRRMGQLQKADEAIRRSISGLQDVTGPYHLAKVSLEKAALLIDRHQPEDAGALIDAASQAAEQSGTRPLLVQAGLVRARQQAAAGQADRAAETLRATLAAAATDLERGEVYFSLWELAGDRDGAQAAMQIYARLAENIRGGEVCRRLEALRAALGD